MPAELAKQVEALEREEAKKSGADIYEENVEAFTLFVDMRTQWKVHGFSGQMLGLHYPSLKHHKIYRASEDKGALEEKIRIMEKAAMAAWSEDRESRRG